MDESMAEKIIAKHADLDILAWRSKIYNLRYKRILKAKDEVIKIISTKSSKNLKKEYKLLAADLLIKSTCKRFLICLEHTNNELLATKKYSQNTDSSKRILKKFDEKIINFSDVLLDELTAAKHVLSNPNSPEYEEYLDLLIMNMFTQSNRYKNFEQKFSTLRKNYSTKEEN
jgi:hypothetical protein